jgi:phosphatidate cytidylyltransferase
MVAVFSVALLLNRAVSLVFFAFVSFLAFKEFLSVVPTRRADRRVLFWAYLAIPIQYLWVGYEWYGMFIVWIPVYAFLLLPLRMVLIGETRGFLGAAGVLNWGLMTTVFSISHVAFLLVLPGRVGSTGASLVLYLVVLTQLNDVAQYVWGRLFGKEPIVPTVSPGKTVAGFVGGVATTLVLAWALAPLLTPLTRYESLAAGLIIGVGGFIGDIVISSMKRDLRIKDAGTLIPGHGGILDRLDSLTYTAPLFFHFVRYFHF